MLLYNTVLVLPYIDMNPPRVYMCSQTWTPYHLPPHNISLGHHRAPAPSILYPASDIDWRFHPYMIVYMLQCSSPKSSHPLPLPLSPKVRSTYLYLFCFSLSCIGERNGNPLQYSCLENPRDRGASWAAVYGVAQSRTRLKRRSSSSSSTANLTTFCLTKLRHQIGRTVPECSNT